MLWVVGVINAVNLLDGLDGLAAGVVMIAIASLSLAFGLNGELGLVLIGTVMCGSIAGFLIYNFNPASIFMGDTGSLFLGYVVAAFTLVGKGNVDPVLALVVPVVALGLPVGDTFLSIFRRAAKRRAIFAPDRDHIHHRLADRVNHRRAVLMMYAMAAFFGVTAVALSVATPTLGWLILLATAGCCVAAIGQLGYLPEREKYLVPTSGTVYDNELPALQQGEPERDRRHGTWERGDGVLREEPPVLNVRLVAPSTN
jgi:UDP-GlcNAc:undecaprenyl-phosphate GlcNAc-1-phosphate transferase